MSPTPAPGVEPGIVAIHSNRTELLAETVAAWLRRTPLTPLEQETVLVQSNGMAEWLKMALARELGVCAVVQTELPSRFAWRMYRRILGPQRVPYQTPLDKADLLWRLMHTLPSLVRTPGDAGAIWQPLRDMLAMAASQPSTSDAAAGNAQATYQLARRIADLLDQYQVYRPDWLLDWEHGQHRLTTGVGMHAPLPDAMHWQAALWRVVVQSLDADMRACTRAHLHRHALAALQAGDIAQPLPRRAVLFGMSHVPLPVLELLGAMAAHSQVLLAVPNPCQVYWSDAIDGRELFHRLHRRAEASDLSAIPLHAMHAHANPLLAMWGRQVRDFIRLLEHHEAVAAQQGRVLPRIDRFDDADAHTAHPTLLAQVQHQIRDLVPLGEAPAPLLPGDASIQFQIAHSPVRELEALHDHLLDRIAATPATDAPHACRVAPREIVVMVPDIAQYAPLIQAVFGQYERSDPRYIPFDIADLGAQDASTLVQAVDWLTRLPESRLGLSELCDWLATPAVAARVGLDADATAQLQAWMQGSGIRWGLDGAHRAQLGVAHMGEQNTAWFGLERMLLGYASPAAWGDCAPYEEIGGLAASHVGALAHLLGRLRHWQQVLTQPATPTDWATRWRALLADCMQAREAADLAALALLEQALQQWLDACLHAGFEQPIPLSVARDAWLSALQQPTSTQRFHAGGVTFCTLLPMRAIPFRIVCLLGMNEGVYPRQATPNEMDLMRLPGMLRAGDRSRAQDDRQLMLEALLSAREQLFISWVGRSARDNSERAPSVLVAQLRDELAARWGREAVQARTVEHALQPFHPRYFLAMPAQDGGLHSWAHEWHPAADSPNGAPATPQHAHAVPPASPRTWTLAELAAIWRNPVEQWFAERLQTRFTALPEPVDDCEPLALSGLQRWQLFQGLADHLAPLMQQASPGLPALQEAAAHYLHRVQQSGLLPLGAEAAQWQAQWLEDWQFLLQHWHQACTDWPQPDPTRWRLPWPLADGAQAATPLVEDWAPALRLASSASADSGSTATIAPGLYLHLLPTTLLDHKGRLKARALLLPWLRATLLATQAATRDGGSHSPSVAQAPMRIIALDAVLDATPMEPIHAQEALQRITTIAAQAVQTPLPFDFVTANTWWTTLQEAKEPDTEAAAQRALRKARDAYDGGYYQGQAAHNPALARIWPDFASLHATGQFEQTATALLEPLHQWLETSVTVRPRANEAEEANDAGDGQS